MKKKIMFTVVIAVIISVCTMGIAFAADSETLLLAGIDPELEAAYRNYSGVGYEMGKFVTVSLWEFVDDYDEPVHGTVDEYLAWRIAELDEAQDIAEIERMQAEAHERGIQQLQQQSKLPIVMVFTLFTAK